MSAIHFDNRSSSPDPLAESFNDASTVSQRRNSRTSIASTKLTRTSLVQGSELQISPSKTVTEQNLSPWRIRVTVEAEPEDDADVQENAEKTGGRRRTITKTMKMPLRGGDESPTRQRRASPARSAGSRRSASPGKRRPSVTDLNAIVLGDDGDEDEWTGKPSAPRRRRSSGNSRRKSAGARKSAEPTDFDVREDEPIAADLNISEHENSRVHSQSPELREIDVNKVAMRPRRASMKRDKGKEGFGESMRKVSVNSMMSYPTPSPTASEHGNSDDRQDELDEGPVGMDTVMESEGFTMIDLDSLPSVKQLRSSPVEQHRGEQHGEDQSQPGLHSQRDASAPIINLSTVEEDDMDDQEQQLPSSPPGEPSTLHDAASNLSSAPSYTIGHLKLPSSTNVQRNRHITPLPLLLESSPKLPSPPKQAQIVKQRSPSSAEKALQAGAALQSAVSPSLAQEATPQQDRNEADLFDGFSSGTARELRAGLRFGEELAKKPLRGVQQDRDEDAGAREELAREERIPGSQVQDAITIADDESSADMSSEEDVVEPDETLGDIWLAAARKTPKGQHQSQSQAAQNLPATQPVEAPKRKLIPSPWKRGERMEAPEISSLTADTSLSGLFWKQPESSSSGHRFGEEILSQPNQLIPTHNRDLFRGRNSDTSTRSSFGLPTHTSRGDSTENGQHVEAQPEELRDEPEWRDATDVVEEETNELEAEKELNMTRLHETNLEDVPEQDMTYPILKPLNFKHYDPNQAQDDSEDEQEPVSEESSTAEIDFYRQRTSLSPSKERPTTPRSALKGGRTSFGGDLHVELVDDGQGERKVAWARRSTCVNENWEESTRSVRSSQEETIDETPTPVAAEKAASPVAEVQNAEKQEPDIQTQPKKGWFSWTRKVDTNIIDSSSNPQTKAPQHAISNFDGPSDNVKSETESSFLPTSKHDSAYDTNTIVVGVNRLPSTIQSTARLSTSKTPSYLLPPSYPSDPTRDPNVPLSTSGTFTKTHLRTLHIIYAKSHKPRFHAPSYPDQVRSTIKQLVQSNWKTEIDESKSFLGEVFTFKVGVTEAMVLERFMREVEHGYSGKDVVWGWTAEELAGWLGRVAVGEVVRAEERASMKSSKV